jgi:hypothetical protein
MSLTPPISSGQVLDYMALNSPGSTSQYSSGTVASNIRSAAASLEKATQRWFMDRGATTWTATTNGRAALYIPGFRSISGVTLQTAPLYDGQSFWALPDAQNSGILTGMQLRPFTSQSRDPSQRWLANPNWFDIAADSPFYPANYGGGYNLTSLPNDLVISGSGGYTDATLPEAFLDAVKIWAAFKTMRPSSLLADVSITPQGGVVNYSSLPMEVASFIAEWRIGEQAVAT